MFFTHHSEVDKWAWPHFSPREIACRGTGEIVVVPDAIEALERARVSVGLPFQINSAYRSRLHNAAVGGAPRSRHKMGDAFDIALNGHNKDELVAACVAAGFTGFGLTYKTFLHVDCGRARTW